MTTPAESGCRALYVHVPFCHTICGYCDFYSQVLDRSAVTPLVDALLAELARFDPSAALCCDTVFVGGGTPTTLPPDELRRLLAGLRRCVDSSASAVEFTVEANPATVSAEIADVLAEAGVTRVSIGAQAFDPAALRVLERIHRPEQVVQTVAACRRVGITNINLDLIFGVPGQSLAAWRRNLAEAVALGPEHLSCYGLTYERGTPLHEQLRAGQVQRVDEEVEAAMFEATRDDLAAAGFAQYEISNYARPGRACRHNLRYWHNEPCVGIGPSAAGFVGGVRYRNVPDTAVYVQTVARGQSPQIERETLAVDRRARETAMLELRLIDGLDCARFRARYGLDPLSLFADAVARHRAAGLLHADGEGIRLTRAGLLVADTVIADFLA